MGFRQQQKEKTRQCFMQTALDMVAEGRSFTSISLRELSARVGLVPTAFYRHFDDLDGLGVAIVSTVLPALRTELKAGR
ncbi:MAG: TetR family transcriptional regulator, partial [Gammaproteobacteria bacterium HGW-Gammaproteobacteria-14]